MQSTDGVSKDPQTDSLPQRAEEMLAQVKERLAPLDDFLRAQIRERPLVVLAGALGLGYLVGRLIRRL